MKKPVVWLRSEHPFLRRYGEHLALGLLVLVVCLVNIVWVRQDTRPQPGADPNHYLTETFLFVDRLRGQGSAQGWQSLMELSLDGRPPLYQVLSVPFILLMGRSEDAALVPNTLFVVILLLSTYGIGKLAVDGRVGLLAALIVATYPPIVNLSKIYRPHAAVPAWAAFSVYLLLLLLKTRSVRVAWLFGLSLGLGMLIHLNFLYLLPLPALLFGLYMVLFQTGARYPRSLAQTPAWLLAKLRDPLFLFGLLPAALTAAGLAAAWYLPQSQSVLGLRQAVISDWIGEAYGFSEVPPSFWWYVLTAPGAITSVSAVLLVLGLVLAGMSRNQGPTVLVVTFLVMYLSFALRIGDLGWLHFAAALPVAAALTAIGIIDLLERLSRAPECPTAEKGGGPWPEMRARSGRVLAALVLGICLAAAVFAFSVVTWGVRPWSRAAASFLGSPLDSFTCSVRMNVAFCPNPARDESWPASDILRTILADPECQERGCSLAVVPKLENLNSFVLGYHLVRDFPGSRQQVRVGSAESWGNELDTDHWVVSDYVVYIPTWRGPDGDRQWRTRVAITNFLEAPSPAYAEVHRQVASFQVSQEWAASLVKRTEPLTVDGAIQTYEEVLTIVPADSLLYRELGYLYLRTEEWSKAEELFEQAVEMDPALGWPYRALGDLYCGQGQAERAIAALRAAIEMEPFDPKAYRSLAALLEMRGDGQDATEVYRLAALNNPRAAWPHLELGSLLVREDRLPEATSEFREAARVEPWNEMAGENLRHLSWSLASSLGTAQVHAGQMPLLWWQGQAWIRPDAFVPQVMVGPSVLEVQGKRRAGQVLLHPFSAEQTTALFFDVEDSHYDLMQIGYALADRVVGLSNGVRYRLEASVDGGVSYAVLWDQIVNDNVWRLQTLPLTPFSGQDVSFQLVVDALGDDAYDWLQTTVRLFPGLQVWDLAGNLEAVQAVTDDVPLVWDGSTAWVDGNGRRLVAPSQAPVHGQARFNQVQIHPFSTQLGTAVMLAVEDNPFAALSTSYALADEAMGRSDGVEYAIAISTDDGQTFATLQAREVSGNAWESDTVDLGAYLGQDLTIMLLSSSGGNDDYDWLQVTVHLIESGDLLQESAAASSYTVADESILDALPQ